jgi:hypothetical protein
MIFRINNRQKNYTPINSKGFGQDWVETGSRIDANYKYLPGGDHVFEVKAANSDGV